MTEKWKTIKGDEWQLEVNGLSAVGDRYPFSEICKDSALVIRSISTSKGSLTENELLHLLRLTQNDQKWDHVVIRLSSFGEEKIETLLEKLKHQGCIEYRIVNAEVSRIECIRQGISHSTFIAEILIHSKKKHWFLGLFT
jgi:hypothetical protein